VGKKGEVEGGGEVAISERRGPEEQVGLHETTVPTQGKWRAFINGVSVCLLCRDSVEEWMYS